MRRFVPGEPADGRQWLSVAALAAKLGVPPSVIVAGMRAGLLRWRDNGSLVEPAVLDARVWEQLRRQSGD